MKFDREQLEQYFRNRLESGGLNMEDLPRLIVNYGTMNHIDFVVEIQEHIALNFAEMQKSTDITTELKVSDIKLSFVSDQNGFYDFNVEGLPLVHRVTIKAPLEEMAKGDLFNVYCLGEVKLGAQWHGGNAWNSLLNFAKTNEHYRKMLTDTLADMPASFGDVYIEQLMYSSAPAIVHAINSTEHHCEYKGHAVFCIDGNDCDSHDVREFLRGLDGYNMAPIPQG